MIKSGFHNWSVSISHEVSSEVKSYVLNDGDVMIRIMAHSDARHQSRHSLPTTTGLL